MSPPISDARKVITSTNFSSTAVADLLGAGNLTTEVVATNNSYQWLNSSDANQSDVAQNDEEEAYRNEIEALPQLTRVASRVG
jgi:hypothetical protein